jgi:hypothetical protein
MTPPVSSRAAKTARDPHRAGSLALFGAGNVIRFPPVKKVFSYEDAAALLPEVQRLTASAVDQVEALANDAPKDEAQRIVAGWAESIMSLGIEVKGLWLIDFDNGSGYYCWQYPEESLQYFHGYDDGFSGRVKLQ